MKRTFKYEFLSRHPELSCYMNDLKFLRRVGTEAEDDPSVSGAVAHGIALLLEGVLRIFVTHLLRVSPLHDRMELELKFRDDGTPYVLVKEEVLPEEASKN